MSRLSKSVFFAFLAAATASFADSPIHAGMSVIRFELPLFNEAGHRSWNLRGEKGIYVSSTEIRIEEMRVSQYSGDEENRRIAILSSPEAVFHFDTTTANGPGELRIKTHSFEVSGSDWIWRGEQKQITLNRDVKVVLFEGIGDILK